MISLMAPKLSCRICACSMAKRDWGLSELQQPVAQDEIDQSVATGQTGDHGERDHRLQQQD